MRFINADLLRRISDGDSIAFKEFFNAYHLWINSIAANFTHSELLAEEIEQDILMKIWINRKSLVLVDNLAPYLFAMTRNHSLNVLKRKKLAKKANFMFSEETCLCEQDETDFGSYRQELLGHFVNLLPSKQRSVYLLCYHQGLKYKDAAKLLNISELTVKTHMHCALRSIRREFKKATFIDPPNSSNVLRPLKKK